VRSIRSWAKTQNAPPTKKAKRKDKSIVFYSLVVRWIRGAIPKIFSPC
jgi:hypothetical protein